MRGSSKEVRVVQMHFLGLATGLNRRYEDKDSSSKYKINLHSFYFQVVMIIIVHIIYTPFRPKMQNKITIPLISMNYNNYCP